MTKLVSITEDFKSSVSRLEEVLSVEKTDIVRDSAIQRFEIAFEMAWKTVKAFLKKVIILFAPLQKLVLRTLIGIS